MVAFVIFNSIRFAKEVGPGGFSTHPPSAGSGKRTVLTELEFQWLPSVHGPRGADLDRTKSLVSFRLSMSLQFYLCAIVAKMTFSKKSFLLFKAPVDGKLIERIMTLVLINGR